MSSIDHIVRRARLDEDMGSILRLFETVFGTEMNEEKWRWKYCPPWGHDAYAWVLEHNGDIIGHIGAVHLPGVLFGKEERYFQIADVMLNPQFRAKFDPVHGALSLFTELRREYPTAVLYGFTGRRPSLWYQRRRLTEKVEDACELVVRATGSMREETAGLYVESWDWDSPHIDTIWNNRKHDLQAGLVRDGTYLRWRYGHHTAHDYLLLGIYHDDQPIGWAIAGNLEHAGSEVRLLDILVPRTLMRASINKLMSFLNINTVILWLPSWYGDLEVEKRDIGMLVHHVTWSSDFPTQYLRDNLYYCLGDVDAWY